MGSKNAGNDDIGCSATVKKPPKIPTPLTSFNGRQQIPVKKKMPGRQTEVLRNDLYQHRLGAPEMAGWIGWDFFGGHRVDRVDRMMVAVFLVSQNTGRSRGTFYS